MFSHKLKAAERKTDWFRRKPSIPVMARVHCWRDHQLQSDDVNCIHLNAAIRLESSCIPPVSTGLHKNYTNVLSRGKFGLLSRPRSGELRTQKLKSHLVRTQSLNFLPFKPGVSQYIAIHATLTARDFFLAYFYLSGPFTCIFSKTSPDFSFVGCG